MEDSFKKEVRFKSFCIMLIGLVLFLIFAIGGQCSFIASFEKNEEEFEYFFGLIAQTIFCVFVCYIFIAYNLQSSLKSAVAVKIINSFGLRH
jgi:hypothetical protein